MSDGGGRPGAARPPRAGALLAVAYADAAGMAALRVVRALVGLLAHEDETVAERAVSLLMPFPSESHRPLARALRAGMRARDAPADRPGARRMPA